MTAAQRVAVVTGASRGAGRGIAAALAERGWKVYGTGRTITAAPPGGVAVRLDHSDDDAVAALFERVGRESGGLDLLVNNAAVVHDELTGSKPFWDKPIGLGDVLDVGLRSAYVASWHAAPLLVRRPRGLIAFTSSPGSVCYMHGPAYGAQKAGIDKMAADMAVDFRGTGVATLSIWMGILLTERLRAAFAGQPEALGGDGRAHRDPGVHRTSDRRGVRRPRVGGAVRADGDRRRTRAAVRDHRRGWAHAAVAPRDARCPAGAEQRRVALTRVTDRSRFVN